MLPIQSNILNRVFFIHAAKYGTAFTIDVEGVEYLVMAKHLFDESATNEEVRLFRNNKWMPYRPSKVAFCRCN